MGIRINTRDHNVVMAVYSIHVGAPLPTFYLKMRCRVWKDECPTKDYIDIVRPIVTTKSDGSKEDFSFPVLQNQRQEQDLEITEAHVTQWDPTINFFGRYYVKVWVQQASQGMPGTFQKIISGLITHRYPLSYPSMIPRHLYEYDFAQFPPWQNHRGDLLVGVDGLIDANYYGTKSRDIWLRSVYLKLVTDANAGDRHIQLQWQDQSNNIWWLVSHTAAIPASTTAVLTFAPALNDLSVTAPGGGTQIITGALPDKMVFKGGIKFYIFIVGKKAGDQIFDIQDTYFERVVE